jgi:hypothetical protein
MYLTHCQASGSDRYVIRTLLNFTGQPATTHHRANVLMG